MSCRPGTSPPGSISQPGCSRRNAIARAPARVRRSWRRSRTSCSRRSAISATSAMCRSTARARPAIGNDLYGSFGRDFATGDGRRVMIIALTRRQWRAIGEATGLGERLAMIGPMMDVDLDTEAGRYEARDAIAALLARWCAGHTLDEIRQAFAGTGVLWGHFQDFSPIGARRPALLRGKPVVRLGRSARHRPLSHAGSAIGFFRRPASAAAPGAAARRAYRRRAYRSARSLIGRDRAASRRAHRRRAGWPLTAPQPSRSRCRHSRNSSRTRRAVRNLRAMSGASRKSP